MTKNPQSLMNFPESISTINLVTLRKQILNLFCQVAYQEGDFYSLPVSEVPITLMANR